ncbi:MAG: nucleotidyltransferase domain-containing protein [Pseudonocardiaceae bacterium]
MGLDLLARWKTREAADRYSTKMRRCQDLVFVANRTRLVRQSLRSHKRGDESTGDLSAAPRRVYCGFISDSISEHNAVTLIVVIAQEQPVAEMLRAAGARFAFVHGSRVRGRPRPDSDLDVGAWWGARPPASWEVDLPIGVDLVVLDSAPLWLAGRIAQEGRLLFDDDPRARVRWQADTRLRYLDEIPAIREHYRQRRTESASGAPRG